MIFTSFTFLYFLAFTVAVYWAMSSRSWQNVFLLTLSYVFYGFIHPWFCILIALSTVTDFFCGRLIFEQKTKRKCYLIVSLVTNLGMLCFFKYFNFFSENTTTALQALGIEVSPILLSVVLPVGISFYTFQTLSYTIDIYKGEMKPHPSFVDFALFVSFFPQLVAGPIERAKRLIPQVASKREFNLSQGSEGLGLVVLGLFKKLVIADNVAIFANQVFTLKEPSLILLAAGALAFTLQILADFSAYTDIARGSAKLLGFELMQNFNMPYLAVSPSDFWRRWHISFSTWIRDYLYIPLGGSKVRTWVGYLAVVTVTMGLSGLWHGASWNFVLWGLYHALLLIVYRSLGLSGRWMPNSLAGYIMAVSVMFSLTVIGWVLFRAPSVSWLMNALLEGGFLAHGHELTSAILITAYTLLYALPLVLMALWKTFKFSFPLACRPLVYVSLVGAIILIGRDGSSDFIYFQF